jgi:hypothetical protein
MSRQTVLRVKRHVADARATSLLAFGLGLLATLAPPRSCEAKNNVEDLAQGILTHVHESLPPSAGRSVEDEAPRVRTFARYVIEFGWGYPTDPARLVAAANTAVDAVNKPDAAAHSLVSAAIAGVVQFINYGDGPAPTCETCKDPSHKPVAPTSTHAGALRLLTFPNLSLPEAVEQKPCSAFAHYFDFPTAGVTGVVLDLRGNQGGYLPAVFCIAGQFLKRDTPLLRLTDRSRTETETAPDTGRHEPITLPLVVLMDAETDSGGLALAAALRDAGRASLIGGSKSPAHAMVRNLVTTRSSHDTFPLPVASMVRISGVPLADGLQVDVAVAPKDDAALLDAARQRFALAATH